jgi:hypothetical protein
MSPFTAFPSVLYILITYLISWVCWGALVLFGIPAKANALSTLLYMLVAWLSNDRGVCASPVLWQGRAQRRV